MKRTILVAGIAALALTAACGGGGSGSGGDSTGGGSSATKAHGPIKIWLSNNKQELAWGKAMVASWNKAHADEQVAAQEIPAGKSSEEVLGAAITAGNAPCLVFNVAPAAVPQFEKQQGLVALDQFPGGADYITERTGDPAKQYASADGKLYQLPWKSNPVMIFYNKAVFTKAGIDTAKPPLSTYDEFIATSKKIVDSKAAKAAIWPAPTSEFFQSWFDFYPLYAAQSGGTQLVKDGKATFDDPTGKKVAGFWQKMYQQGLAPKETFNGDSFATGNAAMAIVGPWAVAVYKDIKWGVVPVPTEGGMPADQIHTFSDAKNVSVFSACKNQGTAFDVLKFATSKEQDQQLLTLTGQMPLRKDLTTTYPDYFTSHPEYKTFAAQAARTTEVPNVPNSIQVWQNFRDAWSGAVIFGKQDIDPAFSAAAKKIDSLVGSG